MISLSAALGLTLAVSPAPAQSQFKSAACYAPGTPDWVVEQSEREAADNAPTSSLAPSADSFQFPDNQRWTATATNGSGLTQGDPTTLTWGVVPDGTPITPSRSGESSANSSLRAFLNTHYTSQTVWQPLLQSVFDRWSEVTGISYVFEPADDRQTIVGGSPAGVLGVRPDIRIAGHSIDGPQNVLAYNYFPSGGGDMVIDTADNTFNDKSNNSRILRNTVAHEHGHGLGISHVCPINETKLMEPFLSVRFDGPMFDDILGGNRGYGDNNEPNDNGNVPTALGAMAPSTSKTVSGVSIDDERDSDWFSFSVGAGASATASVIPVGTTYLDGPQSVSPCSAGTNFDALRQGDLGIGLIDSNKSTILAFQDSAALGVRDTLTNIALPSGAGTYYVQVYSKTSNKVQMYDMTLSVTGGAVPDFTLYESVDRTSVVVPANAVAPVATSPFDWVLTPGPILYYQIDDGAGSPPLIHLAKGGSGVLFYFQ